ncbi:MAG: BatA domain-containing protein [Candidatus Neomarinimicrobiota bacterium]
MSFLIPQVLWALPAAALPLIIHLISKSNPRVVDFSTLHFLRRMEHESIRRLRWHQWLIVFLRTLLLLVLVLLLARPVVKGYFHGWIGDSASTLSVVIIDDSFSLSGEAPQTARAHAGGKTARTTAALESLYEILADQSSRGRVVIMRSSDAKTIYEGPVADLPVVDEIAGLCTPTYHQDNLAAALDSLSANTFKEAANLYANRELFLISDFQSHQQQALRLLGSDTTTWQDWHFFLVPTPHLEHNVTVTRAEVETAIPLAGKLMEVTATLLNSGSEPRSKIPVQVVLNDVRSGQLVVDLRPGERRTVKFQVAPTEPGHQHGYVEIDRDERPGDNRFYFHTYIPPMVRILLIEPPDLDPSFSLLALHSLAGETPNIQLRVCNPSDFAWTPQDLEVVILNSLKELPRLQLRQVGEFLKSGGTLFVIPGPEEESGLAVAVLQNQYGLPALEPTPQVFDSPLALDRKALETSILNKVFQREAELDELPQVSRLYPVYPRGTDEVVLWADEHKPVLTRSSYDSGTIFLFALAFHLQWTNLPLKGSFIPLWHHLIYWRPASSVLADVRVGDLPVLTVTPRQATQSMTLTAPSGTTTHIVPVIRTRTVPLQNLHMPGIYILSAHSRGQPGTRPAPAAEIQFRVNITDTELTNGTLSRSALMSLFDPGRAFIIPEGESAADWIQQARFGQELWRPLLYLLILLLILEMILSNVYRSSRRSAQPELT